MGFAATQTAVLVAGTMAALGGALFEAPTKAIVAALAPEDRLGDLYAEVGILQNVSRTSAR